MRVQTVLTLSCAVCQAAHAANAPLEQLGREFNQPHINVVWDAPTNNLPGKLWVYRASPLVFSPATISNFMALGGFTANDKNRDAPSGIWSFSNTNTKARLWIYSERGYIDYHNPKADNIHNPEGVPDETVAFALATNYMPMFGIERSQLATKTNGDLRTYVAEETATLYKGLGMPAYATNVHMRGVYFIRSIDGIDFAGNGGRGGYEMEFGFQGKVSRALISWRALKRDKLYPVATPDTLLKWIHEGKAVYEPSADQDIRWPDAKKLTITKVTPYYFGEVYSEPQNTVSPFAMLEATVDTGQTNLTFILDCPILDKAK